jgi:tetratricopeptide (TPR) repeat protein
VTTVFISSSNKIEPTIRGTHVFIVGVGEYPCLLGGDPDRLLKNPMGLEQLSSPPLSAVALADWFLGRQARLGQDVEKVAGFHNPYAPLASVEMLVSPGLAYACPDGRVLSVDAAEKKKIGNCYGAWIERAKSSPGNIAVFYFCGHGASGSNDYILPSDFGKDNPLNPWADAIDITETARAARREIDGSLYFFIDACRQASRDALMPGATAPALQSVDFGMKVLCFTRLLLWATAEGAHAFGAKRQASRFTAALVEALSGFYGERLADDADSWVVTGDALARSVRTLLETQNSSLEDSKQQHIEQQLIGSQAFHHETREPQTVGKLASTWSVHPTVREHTRDEAGSRTLAAEVQEALAEELEQRNSQVDQLRDEIREWTQRYQELEQRLAQEPDSDLAQKARAHLLAGKLEEAGTLLDELIKAAEARIDADRIRLASHYLSRAEVYSLQFKPLDSLPCYRKASELVPDDPLYSIPYADRLLPKRTMDTPRLSTRRHCRV